MLSRQAEAVVLVVVAAAVEDSAVQVEVVADSAVVEAVVATVWSTAVSELSARTTDVHLVPFFTPGVASKCMRLPSSLVRSTAVTSSPPETHTMR